MKFKNLLVLTTGFPDQFNRRISDIFVKEQVNYLKNYFENVYVIAPTSIWTEYLLKEHFENYSYDNVQVYYPLCINFPAPYVPKYLKRFWIFFEKIQIEKLIKSEKINFDLIHAHFTWHPGAVAVELKKDFNVPVVITEHTSITLHKALKRKDHSYFKAWRESDTIIRVLKIKEKLFKKFNKNTVNIPNGFDEKKFYRMAKEKCRDKLNLPTDRKIIFTIGYLIEVKGHKYSIEAIEEIIKRRKDILYIIGGSGPLKDKLQNKIDESNLQEYIKLIGFVPHEELPILMNACDLFLLPSLSEGNPTVMFECLGCGKPFIGTKVGGEPDIITSDDYGLLCEPANSKELAEKILVALNKNWDGGYILNYAKQFTWEKIAEEIAEVYKGVTCNHKTRDI